MISTNGTKVVIKLPEVEALDAPFAVCKKEINDICKSFFYELLKNQFR